MKPHFGELAIAVVLAMGLWTALPGGASAQGVCSDDAGLCGEDGGGLGGGIGGGECSCETLLDQDGRIHVCTDSYERDVCEQFSCREGTERTRACPTREVQLCCEMPEQGTQSRLYDDCTHPNCESGFRDQCGDFGGTVHDGDCDVSAVRQASEGTSLCAVRQPGVGTRRASAWPLAAVLLLVARRRRACAQGKTQRMLPPQLKALGQSPSSAHSTRH